MKVKLALFALAMVPLSACSDGAEEDEISDASKLSDELEARALEIEERAEQAVIAVEQEAEEELTALNAEAEQADARAEEAKAEPPENNDSEQ